MEYKKLSADCDIKLLELVKKVAEIEKRTVANFIRMACEEKAERILGDGNTN